MTETHDYKVRLAGVGQKQGVIDSPEDGLPIMQVASPPQFGGPEGMWSPEHLFVASVSSCLMTTFQAIATNSRLEVLEYSDDASGRLVRGDDRLFRIDRVTLRPRLVIDDPAHADKARRLLEKAKDVCLISRSMSAEVVMVPSISAADRIPA